MNLVLLKGPGLRALEIKALHITTEDLNHLLEGPPLCIGGEFSVHGPIHSLASVDSAK